MAMDLLELGEVGSNDRFNGHANNGGCNVLHLIEGRTNERGGQGRRLKDMALKGNDYEASMTTLRERREKRSSGSKEEER